MRVGVHAADHDPRSADRRQPARPPHERAPPPALPADGGDRPERLHDAVRAPASSRRGCRASTPSLERAASDLGANTFNRLRYVVLPLIAPAVFAGALFAFTLSLDEFIITLFLIGGSNTLPIYIYTQVKFGITPEVNALATLLLAASLILIALAFLLPTSCACPRRRVRVRRVRR